MGRIRHKAAAVIRFIDTVTQAPVSGSSLYIRIEQKSPIIWKEDGYVVIMEQPGVECLDISVSGGRFSPLEFHMDIMREAPVQIQYIHLLPASGYPFTRQMAVIRGDGASGELYAVRVADSGKYRLMENLSAGENRIKLWGNERFSPGQQLLLSEEDRYELVTLLEADDETEHGYRTVEQLKGAWKKGKTKIYSAVQISPDDSGSFCIAYDRISKEGEEIRFLSVMNEENAPLVDKVVEIQEGQETEFHVGG